MHLSDTLFEVWSMAEDRFLRYLAIKCGYTVSEPLPIEARLLICGLQVHLIAPTCSYQPMLEAILRLDESIGATIELRKLYKALLPLKLEGNPYAVVLHFHGGGMHAQSVLLIHLY